MAVDARIAMGVRAPDMISALDSGLESGERLRTRGMRDELLNQQSQANQISLEQASQNKAMQGVINYGKVVDGLASIPDMAQRAKILAQQIPMLEEAGIPVAQLTSMDLSDAGLKNVQAGMRPFLAKSQAGQVPANIQSFDYFQDVIASPSATEDQKKAARIELKLDSPAPTNYQKTMIDIKKENNEIKRLEGVEKKETNDLKKQKLQEEIKVKQAKIEADSKGLVDSAQRDLTVIDTTLATVTELAGHEGLDAAVGGTSFFPTFPGSPAADFIAKFDQLKGKQFLAEVQKMKGMGSLSENEGKKVAAAAAALDLSMSEEAFRRELTFIESEMTRARKKMAGKLPISQSQPTPESNENQGLAVEMSNEDLLKSLGL